MSMSKLGEQMIREPAGGKELGEMRQGPHVMSRPGTGRLALSERNGSCFAPGMGRREPHNAGKKRSKKTNKTGEENEDEKRGCLVKWKASLGRKGGQIP